MGGELIAVLICFAVFQAFAARDAYRISPRKSRQTLKFVIASIPIGLVCLMILCRWGGADACMSMFAVDWNRFDAGQRAAWIARFAMTLALLVIAMAQLYAFPLGVALLFRREFRRDATFFIGCAVFSWLAVLTVEYFLC